MFCNGYGIEEFAEEAYDPADQREKVIDGYDYKPNLSTDDVAVYEEINPDTKMNPHLRKAIVSFRGTSKSRDIRPDIGIAGNRFKNTDRYKSDKAQLDKILGLYGKDKVRLTGHSLGSTVATTLGQEYGIRTDGFNTGSTPLQMEQNLFKNLSCKVFPSQQSCQNAKKITHHIVPYDPISIWNLFTPANVKYHSPKSWNVHSMSNFSGLDID